MSGDSEFLAETLESVRTQSYANYDLIVVDDASTDATGEILSTFAAGDNRASIITHAVNLGQAAAFNTGISAATGEYVALLDADDLWLPEKLSVCAQFIAMHCGVDFLQHNLKLLIEDERSERLFRPTLASGDYIQQMRDSNSYFPGPFTPTAGLVFSKSLLDRVLPIPTALRICADGFLTRASAALAQVASAPVPLGYYRLHGANATVGNDDYDVNSYTSRVLAPLLQDFYDRLERPIKLAKFKDTRRRTRIEFPRDARFGTETEFDIRFRDAVRLLFLGIPPTVRFSNPFLRFLERCRVLVDRSDLEGLLDEIPGGRRALPDAEDPLATMIEALMRWQTGERGNVTALLATLDHAATDSIAVAACEFAAARTPKDEASAPALLRRHTRAGRLSLGHVEHAMDSDIVERDVAGFLSLLRATADAKGHSAAYFDADEWIVETVPTVDAWKSEFIGRGTPAKLFADRRMLPPPQVAEAIKAYVRGLPGTGGPVDAGADWSTAVAIDLPGARVFSGEWQIRSAEGALVTDAYERVPLGVSSAYGRISQHQSHARLVTSSEAQHVGAVYVLGGDGGYGAWVLDVLPRALWFSQDPRGHGMRGLLTPGSGAFQGEFLERLGLSADRVIEAPYPSVCFADRVVLPLLGPACSEFRACYGPVRRWAHDHAGALFYEGYSVAPWTAAAQGRRVFVRQTPSEQLVLIREDETAALFAEAGFDIVQTTDLSVAEQVRLFNEAGVVVGPHGPAMANICFCRPETQVMELAFPEWPSNRLQAVALGRGLRHQRLYLRTAFCFQSSHKDEAGYLDPGRIGPLLAACRPAQIAKDGRCTHDSRIDTLTRQKAFFRGIDSRQALILAKDRHAGRRAFVIGNGPSLNVDDLDRLKDEVTFAANRIFLAYDQTSFWRPTYWCCADELVAKNNLEEIAGLEHIKFGAFNVADIISHLPYTFTVARPKGGAAAPRAGLDLLSGVTPGVSVVIFMMKLAYWMGIETIYLLGMDFNFVVPAGAKTGEKAMGNEVIVSQGERNHFHPDYRKPGEKWTMPLMDRQQREFQLMRWRLESAGRRVFNASRRSKLGTIGRVNFDDIVP